MIIKIQKNDSRTLAITVCQLKTLSKVHSFYWQLDIPSQLFGFLQKPNIHAQSRVMIWYIKLELCRRYGSMLE